MFIKCPAHRGAMRNQGFLFWGRRGWELAASMAVKVAIVHRFLSLGRRLW